MQNTDSPDRSAMSFGGILSWAWAETPPVHRNRVNLLIHMVAVPLFVAGHILLVAALASRWVFVIPAVLCVVLSLLLQKVGHGLELQAVHPFTGPRDFVRRLYAEQFINFWRFLLSGGWYASFRSSATGAAPSRDA